MDVVCQGTFTCFYLIFCLFTVEEMLFFVQIRVYVLINRL